MADSRLKKRHKNLCLQIMNRSVTGSTVRDDIGIIRTLISKGSNHFTKAWSQTSKNPIAFDYQFLFLDKFRTVLNTNGSRGKPLQIYSLPPLRTKEKIESAVLFESALDQRYFTECEKNKDFRPCLIAITADGYLIRQDLKSGRKLQSIYLSSKYKFKHIFWENDLHKVVLSSVHAKMPPRATLDNRSCVFRTLMYLTLFEIAPLRFLANIPIVRNVFGADVIDASISRDILFLMHQGGMMKLYSLKEILDKFTTKASIGQLYNFTECSLDQHDVSMRIDENWGTVGEYPFGVPVNVKFDNKPTLLQQICSHQHLLSFGGFPWHYIVCPKKQNSVFKVYTMKDQVPVKHGLLNSAVQTIEQDQAYFHKDNSGRILHIGSDFISYLKLDVVHNDQEEQLFEIQTSHSINLQDVKKTNGSMTLFSSSGRRIKCNSTLDYDNPGYSCVRDVDFEDELDILVVLSSQGEHKGGIGLYDNQTGILVKEIQLDYWEDDSDHSIHMELDTIVHIFKRPTRNYCCEIFKLLVNNHC
ncbi:DDB1- and CUL4-associated factor 17-like [Actinia tenebrosa]|uniref:DDB1- and CUL4-associated factor 17-like n=1 Tax=Actinia tenebrosa TaxID=6105 RepID=A0A6P8J6F2_ACTTE|nr:DDB1- and CUL4-associated factor 17-like [Actinia tenebrosa]